MEAPEKIYIHPDIGGREFLRPWLLQAANSESIEYVRTDSFIEKVANYLNYILYDRVEINNPGTIIPSLLTKGEFIDDFKRWANFPG